MDDSADSLDSPANRLKINHRSDRFALVHQIERRVDLLQLKAMSDEFVDQNFFV